MDRNTVKTAVMLAGLGGLLVVIGGFIFHGAGAIIGLAIGGAAAVLFMWKRPRGGRVR